MFKLLKTEGAARRGEFTCAHGTVQTPVFMNVGTQGAIKGALSAEDLKNIGCQVELSNTYHLHLRPGDELVKECGGLHKFMTWDGPILTDSGGFQVFSLASLRKIKEEGVTFASHIDGHKIFMGPEESMQIQSNLGSDICMAFDECIENPAPRDYVKASVDRTYRWLVRCKNDSENFNVLTADPDECYSVENVADEDTANEISRGLMMGNPEIKYSAKIGFPQKFVELSRSAEVTGKICKLTIPAMAIVGLVLGIISIIKTGNL